MPAADPGADRVDRGVGAGAARDDLLPALSAGSAIALRIERGAAPDWGLDLRGRWARTADDAWAAQVTGTLRGPGFAESATGAITFWPRHLPGGIVVGSRRIALEVTAGRRRLVLDGEVGPPPYLTGITLPGRLCPEEADTAVDDDVTVWIAPTQLLELWFRLNL